MAEPVSTTGVIAVGAMLTTGGLMADLVIFNDSLYPWLALTGAVVSTLGTAHELSQTKDLGRSFWQILGELVKGFVLGILAIPFWYLVLSSAGEAVVGRILEIKIHDMANSVWLIASFYLSWFTVPVIDWFARKFAGLKKLKVSFNWKVGNKDD